MDTVVELLKQDPAVENVLSVNGYSIINTALQSNAGMVIVKLKPWHDRKTKEQHQFFLQAKYHKLFAQYPAFKAIVFGAPPIPGLGAISGFSFVLEDTQSQGADKMAEVLGALSQAASSEPQINRAFSSFRSGTPQINLEIDRLKAKLLGVKLTDIFGTLQTQLGGLYVNDFNLYGQTYKVMLQADAPFRQKESDLKRLYVSNAAGDLIPLSSFVTPQPSRGPDVLYRYNTYDSATLTGIPNAAGGYSSGEAMAAIEKVAADQMPAGYKYEWTDSSF